MKHCKTIENMTEQEMNTFRFNRSESQYSNLSFSNNSMQFLIGTENKIKTAFKRKPILIGIGIIVITIAVVATTAALLPNEDRDPSHSKGNLSLSGLNI